MKLKETRILDAEGARYACIANDYCTRCDCEEYDRILNDAAESSRKPGGITVDDLARIAEAIKARSETDDDVPAIAFALPRRTVSHFTEARSAAHHETRKEVFKHENLYPPQHCRMGRLHGR